MQVAISTVLDIIIAVIFIVAIVIGAKRGLIQSVVGLLGKIVSAVIAFIFSENLGAYIDENYIRGTMKQWLVNQLSPTAENVQASVESLDLDSLFSEMPTFFTKIVSFLGIDTEAISDKYYAYVSSSGEEIANSFITDAMVTPISSVISRVIAFAIIFLICTICIAVLWWLSDILVNIPVIHQLDRVGGVILGILNGVVLVLVFVAIFNCASGYFLKNMTLEEIEQLKVSTILFSFFNKINPLNSYFGGWL